MKTCVLSSGCCGDTSSGWTMYFCVEAANIQNDQTIYMPVAYGLDQQALCELLWYGLEGNTLVHLTSPQLLSHPELNIFWDINVLKMPKQQQQKKKITHCVFNVDSLPSFFHIEEDSSVLWFVVRWLDLWMFGSRMQVHILFYNMIFIVPSHLDNDSLETCSPPLPPPPPPPLCLAVREN